MKKQIGQGLTHAALAMLLSLGLTLPVLRVLGLMDQALPAAVTVVLLSAAMGVASSGKPGRRLLLIGGGLAALVWIGPMGGAGDAREVLAGILLNASGLPYALPVIAGKAAMLLAVVVTVTSFVLTIRGAGMLPSALAVAGAMAALWLCSAGDALRLVIPAAAAVLTVGAVSRNEELAVRRVLPVMGAIACAAMLLVPAQGVTIVPMKQAAEELRQRILDYFFFTEPRNVFSLATEGYYPNGSGQLGGTAQPANHPVMVVHTPSRVYLRGTVKNEYTGRAWLDTTGGRRYLWVSPRWTEARERIFDAHLPAGMLAESNLLTSQNVTVRMVDAGQSTLFVPQRVRSLSAGGDMVPYFNNGSEVFITRDLQPGDTYSVAAPLVRGGDAGLDMLLEGCARSGDSAYAQIVREYTGLPDHLQSQVYELSQQAVGNAASPYAKALAIQSWLKRFCRYTLEVAPVDENVDFVSSFLLVTREGYCTYFATAMTVLCRMVGLPARYVEGYVADPDENGLARVTGLDAHAWTEIYFEGFGWLTFDATPMVGDGGATPPPEGDDGGGDEDETPPAPTPAPAPSQEPENVPDPTPAPSQEPEEIPTPAPDDQTPPREEPQPTPAPKPETRKEPPSPVWWLLLAIVAAAAGLVWRILAVDPRRKAARQGREMGKWNVWMQEMNDILAVRGQKRAPSESLNTFLVRMDAMFPGMHLAEIGECTSDVFYGQRSPLHEDVKMIEQACTALKNGLDRSRRLRLLARRAFTRLSSRRFTGA